MELFKWEQHIFHVRVQASDVEGGRMGLKAECLIPKTGKFVNYLCVRKCCVRHILCTDECMPFVPPTACIAYCWGRFRVTGAGPAEDLFNPVYAGCFDRIVKLHRCMAYTTLL